MYNGIVMGHADIKHSFWSDLNTEFVVTMIITTGITCERGYYLFGPHDVIPKLCYLAFRISIKWF